MSSTEFVKKPRDFRDYHAQTLPHKVVDLAPNRPQSFFAAKWETPRESASHLGVQRNKREGFSRDLLEKRRSSRLSSGKRQADKFACVRLLESSMECADLFAPFSKVSVFVTTISVIGGFLKEFVNEMRDLRCHYGYRNPKLTLPLVVASRC